MLKESRSLANHLLSLENEFQASKSNFEPEKESRLRLRKYVPFSAFESRSISEEISYYFKIIDLMMNKKDTRLYKTPSSRKIIPRQKLKPEPPSHREQ